MTRITVVIVARHGERLDYVMRDNGKNWQTTDSGTIRPFDTPLTDHGHEQGEKLGRHLVGWLQRLNLPPISNIYSSPFLRCRQTAIAARKGANDEMRTMLQKKTSTSSSSSSSSPSSEAAAAAAAAATEGASSSVVEEGVTTTTTTTTTEEEEQEECNGSGGGGGDIAQQQQHQQERIPTVRVELGLAESINESWYRSWALPGSDGTWGYRMKGEKKIDPDTIHPASKEPVQPLLDWKVTIKDDSSDIAQSLDMDYESISNVERPYTLHPPVLETNREQRRRMMDVVNAVNEPDQSVLLVSHGGPVTHLYEEMTGNPWIVHGESSYCCYSIYRRIGNHGKWEAVAVNQAGYLNEEIKTERHVLQQVVPPAAAAARQVAQEKCTIQ